MSKKTRIEKRTVAHSAVNHALPVAAWRRMDTEWFLNANGQPRARITRDGKRWLCWRTEDIGDDGLIGPMLSLAAAKAYLGRRVQFIPQLTPEWEEAPL
jgi:hypothetical protein